MSLQPYTEWSSRSGSEPSSMEADVCIWCYALLVVHARKEEEEDDLLSNPYWCNVQPTAILEHYSDTNIDEFFSYRLLGTICWNTCILMTLVMGDSSQNWRHFCLCDFTHQRHFWERSFKSLLTLAGKIFWTLSKISVCMTNYNVKEIV